MSDGAKMDCPGCGAPKGYPPAGPCKDHGTKQAIATFESDGAGVSGGREAGPSERLTAAQMDTLRAVEFATRGKPDDAAASEYHVYVAARDLGQRTVSAYHGRLATLTKRGYLRRFGGPGSASWSLTDKARALLRSFTEDSA